MTKKNSTKYKICQKTKVFAPPSCTLTSPRSLFRLYCLCGHCIWIQPYFPLVITIFLNTHFHCIRCIQCKIEIFVPLISCLLQNSCAINSARKRLNTALPCQTALLSHCWYVDILVEFEANRVRIKSDDETIPNMRQVTIFKNSGNVFQETSQELRMLSSVTLNS